MNRERVVSSFIVALVGLFYILTPYETKVSWNIDFGLSASVLVLLGILLIIISVYNLFTKPPATKKQVRKVAKNARRKRKARRRRRR